MSKKKYLYLFSEGNKDMREILGGKGANLAEMTNAGMPVPQGFTISTEACTQYYNDGRQINEEIMADIYEYIGKLEEIAGKKFGDVNNPLLVSVRSGARASMPGMMDTILNLGLNDEAVEGLAKLTNNPRFAYDSYRRFVQMFSRRCDGDVQIRLREDHRRDEGGQGRHAGRGAGCRRHEGSGGEVQGPVQGKDGQGLPLRPEGAAH